MDNALPFLEVFPIQIDDETRTVLSKVEVSQVVYRAVEGELDATLHFSMPGEIENIAPIEAAVAEFFHLKKVAFLTKYPAETFNEEIAVKVAKHIARVNPRYFAYLDGADYRVTANHIEIELRNGGAEFLRDYINDVVTYVDRHFGVPVTVTFCGETEFSGVVEQRMAEMQARILEREKTEIPVEVPKEKPKKPQTPQNGQNERRFYKSNRVKMGEMLYGKGIDPDLYLPMSDLTSESGDVTVKGTVFAINHRELRNEKTVVCFDITDLSGSVTTSRFMKNEEAQPLMDEIKVGDYLTITGEMSYNTYEHDMSLKFQSISRGKKALREDKGFTKRVELHAHTFMSTMDGVETAEELVKTAARWGHKAVAVTDHGVLQAYPDAMKAAAKYGVKVIYGVEAYYSDDSATIKAVKGEANTPLNGEFVALDLETTGLSSSKDRITELAAVIIRNGEFAEELATFIDPQMPIPEKVTDLTGITNAMVAGSPTTEEFLPKFLEFVGDRPIIAHNADFDIGFIRAACERSGIEKQFTTVDTLAMSRAMLPQLSQFKLNQVAAELGLPKFNHHRAMDDTKTCGLIAIRLFTKMQETEKKAMSLSAVNQYLASLGNEKAGRAKTYHMIILVRNMVGLKNLYKIVSDAHLKYFSRVPVVPRSLLDKYREGLIVGSACEAGELFRAMVAGKTEQELETIASYYDYLEVQPLSNNSFMLRNGTVSTMKELQDFNRRIVEIGDKLGKPVVATGDVHFLEPEDKIYRAILMASKGFDDADNQADLYFKPTDEMLGDFAYLGDDVAQRIVVDEPNRIAEMCEEIIPLKSGTYPPTVEGSKDELISLTEGKAHQLYGEPLPDIVRARIDKELGTITKYGFDVMYMIAQKLVAKSNSDGYLVGSRGSVGSSVVAYFSGITEVNALPPHYRCPNCRYSEFYTDGSYPSGVDMPDKNCPKCGAKLDKDGFDIQFETFLPPGGQKAPDIDLNFSGEYQPVVHKYTEVLFGEGHVFRAGTIAAVQDKTAYGYVKKYLAERGLIKPRAEENRLAVGCTGVKRTTGQHPGGVIIVPKDLEIYDFCPIQHPADKSESDIITTHFDYHSIHDNLLKLDLLGHDDPTMIRMLEDLSGIDVRKIPLDDPDTMSIFTGTKALKLTEEDDIIGETGAIAIPEFGTRFVRGMLVDTRPTTFDGLLRISGLSHGTNVWLGNAQDIVRNGVATLQDIVACRDDIMKYLIFMGVDNGIAFKIMEAVRKGKHLTPEYEALMREHNVPEWYIESCNKIQYLFPKAHAVAYVMMAFRIAWFKVHYPLYFYAAYFSIRAVDAGTFDANYMLFGDGVVRSKLDEIAHNEKASAAEKDMATTLEVVHEFYARGFKFEPIDLYQSDATRFKVTENGLIPPFATIPGLGANAAKALVEERTNGPFLSQEEMTFRCSKISKSVCETLEKFGALGDLPKTGQMTLF